MTDEWTDDDCPRCRAAFTYLLRAHVRHQDGRDSQAPMLVFADADYEDGDGSMGLHGDAKRANEPAIVFVRADQFLDAAAERDALRAALEKTWAVLEQIESHRRLCMQYDEENGHVPRTFDEEDLRIMEIAARAAMKEIERAITDKPRRSAE